MKKNISIWVILCFISAILSPNEISGLAVSSGDYNKMQKQFSIQKKLSVINKILTNKDEKINKETPGFRLQRRLILIAEILKYLSEKKVAHKIDNLLFKRCSDAHKKLSNNFEEIMSEFDAEIYKDKEINEWLSTSIKKLDTNYELAKSKVLKEYKSKRKKELDNELKEEKLSELKTEDIYKTKKSRIKFEKEVTLFLNKKREAIKKEEEQKLKEIDAEKRKNISEINKTFHNKSANKKRKYIQDLIIDIMRLEPILKIVEEYMKNKVKNNLKLENISKIEEVLPPRKASELLKKDSEIYLKYPINISEVKDPYSGEEQQKLTDEWNHKFDVPFRGKPAMYGMTQQQYLIASDKERNDLRIDYHRVCKKSREDTLARLYNELYYPANKISLKDYVDFEGDFAEYITVEAPTNVWDGSKVSYYEMLFRENVDIVISAANIFKRGEFDNQRNNQFHFLQDGQSVRISSAVAEEIDGNIESNENDFDISKKNQKLFIKNKVSCEILKDKIEFTDDSGQKRYIQIRKLTLTNCKGKVLKVKYQLLPNSTVSLDMIKKCREFAKKNGLEWKKILVNCKSGIDRTGRFCVLDTVISILNCLKKKNIKSVEMQHLFYVMKSLSFIYENLSTTTFAQEGLRSESFLRHYNLYDKYGGVVKSENFEEIVNGDKGKIKEVMRNLTNETFIGKEKGFLCLGNLSVRKLFPEYYTGQFFSLFKNNKKYIPNLGPYNAYAKQIANKIREKIEKYIKEKDIEDITKEHDTNIKDIEDIIKINDIIDIIKDDFGMSQISMIEKESKFKEYKRNKKIAESILNYIRNKYIDIPCKQYTLDLGKYETYAKSLTTMIKEKGKRDSKGYATKINADDIYNAIVPDNCEKEQKKYRKLSEEILAYIKDKGIRYINNGVMNFNNIIKLLKGKEKLEIEGLTEDQSKAIVEKLGIIYDRYIANPKNVDDLAFWKDIKSESLEQDFQKIFKQYS